MHIKNTDVSIKQAFNSVKNTTKGHKRCYQTRYQFGVKYQTGTQALAIYQALNRSLP